MYCQLKTTRVIGCNLNQPMKHSTESLGNVWYHQTCIVSYCGRVPAANAPGCTAAEGLFYKPWSLVLPTCTARCLHQRNGRWILPENARLPRNIQGSFTCRKSTTWNKRLCFPSEGRRAEDFFALKNSKVLAVFEPANLGTKGQHATSRPPKPLTSVICRVIINWSAVADFIYFNHITHCAFRDPL